jgi:hypothetical protein
MAVALFPLYEGETLGSNFARYAEFVGLKSTSALRQRLFGYGCTADTLLPSAIGSLAEQARDYWNMSADQIIKGHTGYMYATMMASPSVRESIYRKMQCPRSGDILRYGVFGLKGDCASRLRYCDECLAEWRKARLTPYWRVDHQLPGVYFCASHASPLKSTKRIFVECRSDVTLESLMNRSDEAIVKKIPLQQRNAILDVAKRSFRQSTVGSEFSSREKYLALLRSAGFVRADGTMNRVELVSEWSEYFGYEYCHLTGMNAKKISMWLFSLSAATRAFDVPHPFMFIAAGSFLEYYNQDAIPFLSGNGKNSTSTKSPNSSIRDKAADLYLEQWFCTGALHRNADTHQITGHLRKGAGWKVACSCGILYAMHSPLPSSTVRMTPLIYGQRYHERFSALMKDGASIRRASRELGIRKSTAARWVRDEGHAKDRDLSAAEIRRLRSEWRRLVSDAPSENRITSAANVNPLVYKSLYQSDRGWLSRFNREHRSWRGKKKYRPEERDSMINRVHEAWMAILRTEPPVRVTQTAILEKARLWICSGGASGILRSLLIELVETRQDYFERVISWLSGVASRQGLRSTGEAIAIAGWSRRRLTKEQMDKIGKLVSGILVVENKLD